MSIGAPVQTNFAHFAGTTTGAVTFTNPVSTNDVIGAWVVTNTSASAAPSSVTDTNSDTLITPLSWQTSHGEGACGLYLFVVGTGGSSFNITVNFAANTTFEVLIFEYSGASISTPVDGSSAYGFTFSGTAPSAGSALTPSQTGDRQVAFVGIANTTTIASWGNSLTQQAASSTSNTPLLYMADLGLASTSAVSATATTNASSPSNMVQILLQPPSGPVPLFSTAIA